MQTPSTCARLFTLLTAFTFSIVANAQYSPVQDGFEGQGTISSWIGDDCLVDPNFPNPYAGIDNPSATVLRYEDLGGTYANVQFTNSINYNMSTGTTFSLKVYVPSAGLSGDAPLQLSLKLQNGYVESSWTMQTEIIKPLVLDEWQTLTFDFSSGEHLNFDPTTGDPAQRVDLNRVVLQVNGEGNGDPVLALIDDLMYDGLIGYDPEQSESSYSELVWSDEFDGAGAVNTEQWYHQTQLPNPWGWFNEEQQHYTDREDNSYVSDGFLHIVAKREDFTDQGLEREFTSARLNSKFAFTYGRVEVRAQLPFGGGTWPAIWTLGKNVAEAGAYWYPEYGTTGWPACGEIDIMEHWGWNQHYVSSALHTPSSSGATENHGGLYAPDVSNEFHIYGMEWSEEEIRFTVDGQVHYVYAPAVQNTSTWPYTEDQYLILNIALQNWVDPAFQESDMRLDYVRVYQEQPSSLSEEDIRTEDFFTWTQEGSMLSIQNNSQFMADLRIYDVQGRLLQSGVTLAPGRQTLDLSHASGSIFLRFEVDGHTWAEQLLLLD